MNLTVTEDLKTLYPNAYRLFAEDARFAKGVGRLINPQVPGAANTYLKAPSELDREMCSAVGGTVSIRYARTGPELLAWWAQGREAGVPQPVGIYGALIDALALDFDYPGTRGPGANTPPWGITHAHDCVDGELVPGLAQAVAATPSATPNRGHAWWLAEPGTGGFFECHLDKEDRPRLKGDLKPSNYLIEHDLEDFARQWYATEGVPVSPKDIRAAFGHKPRASRGKKDMVPVVAGDPSRMETYVQALAQDRERRGKEATLHEETKAHLVSMWRRGFTEEELAMYVHEAQRLGCDQRELARLMEWCVNEVEQVTSRPLPMQAKKVWHYEWDGQRHEVSTDRGFTALASMLDTLGVDIVVDTRSGRRLLRKDGKYICMDRSSESTLRGLLEESHYTLVKRGNAVVPAPVSWSKDAWATTFEAYLSDGRRYDFFEHYLNSLPAWDGTRRLAAFCHKVFRCDKDDPIGLWGGPWVFCKAVQRTFIPGHPCDDMLILQGKQGGGKSTLFPHAFPEGEQLRDNWVRTSFSMLSAVKQGRNAAYSLMGAVFVMVNEMKGITDAKVEDVKDFLTRPRDEADMKFESQVATNPRRCVFIGTTNSGEFLKTDLTGYRRFRLLPVQIDRSNRANRNWVEDNRDQLWAEALHYYRSKSTRELDNWLEMSDAAHAEAERRADMSRVKDAAEEELRRILGNNPENPEEQGHSTTDWCARLRITPGGENARGPTMQEARRVAVVLKAYGFENFDPHGWQYVGKEESK